MERFVAFSCFPFFNLIYTLMHMLIMRMYIKFFCFPLKKVRQMFDERRQRSTGIDKSYPLQPITTRAPPINHTIVVSCLLI